MAGSNSNSPPASPTNGKNDTMLATVPNSQPPLQNNPSEPENEKISSPQPAQEEGKIETALKEGKGKTARKTVLDSQPRTSNEHVSDDEEENENSPKNPPEEIQDQVPEATQKKKSKAPESARNTIPPGSSKPSGPNNTHPSGEEESEAQKKRAKAAPKGRGVSATDFAALITICNRNAGLYDSGVRKFWDKVSEDFKAKRKGRNYSGASCRGLVDARVEARREKQLAAAATAEPATTPEDEQTRLVDTWINLIDAAKKIETKKAPAKGKSKPTKGPTKPEASKPQPAAGGSTEKDLGTGTGTDPASNAVTAGPSASSKRKRPADDDNKPLPAAKKPHHDGPRTRAMDSPPSPPLIRRKRQSPAPPTIPLPPATASPSSKNKRKQQATPDPSTAGPQPSSKRSKRGPHIDCATREELDSHTSRIIARLDRIEAKIEVGIQENRNIKALLDSAVQYERVPDAGADEEVETKGKGKEVVESSEDEGSSEESDDQ